MYYALRSTTWRLSLMYVVYYGNLGAVVPYMALFLEQRLFTPVEIGQLIAATVLARVVSPNLAASVAIRYVMTLCASMVVAVAALLLLPLSFPLMLGCFFCYGFFWHAILPLLEAGTNATIRRHPGIYAQMRSMGSVGFIAAVLLCSWWYSDGDYWLFPVVIMVLMTAFFLLSLRPWAQYERPGTQGLIRRIWQPSVLLVLTASMLHQASHSMYYSFFTLYLIGAGYSTAMGGALWALGVAAEIVAFQYIHTSVKRFDAARLLIIVYLITCVRWAVTGFFVDQFWLLVLAQCAHAISFALHHAVITRWISQRFSAGNSPAGFALYSSYAYGFGGGMGALAAGYLWALGGGLMVFQAAALISLLSAAMMFGKFASREL